MTTPLSIGPLTVDPPVVLAPMAGVTNAAFRQLCRRYGAGLYVSEMVNARGLMEDGEKSWQLAHFAPGESPRSLQLYGTDPVVVGEAVRRLVDGDHVDHVDLNFGCPAPKVTRHGGGAALPARPRLFASVVDAAVRAAGPVPVTVKMRIGLDDERTTFLEAGRLAAGAGAAAVALHARTAAQRYSGRARWSAIEELVEALPGTPGARQRRHLDRRGRRRHGRTHRVRRGGRGPGLPRPAVVLRPARRCLRRSSGASRAPSRRGGPDAAEHARLLVAAIDEDRGVRMMRKHLAWYLTGFPVGPAARKRLTSVSTLAELDDALADLDPSLTVTPEAARQPRGTQTGPHAVVVPDGLARRRLDHPARRPRRCGRQRGLSR